MADPGAPSGAVAEITTTSGTGPYQLNVAPPNALAAYFRFADVFVDGQVITYEVDDTARKEICKGTFSRTANTLTRTTVLYSSNGNQLIDWPATGQRLVRPLENGLPLCDVVPTNGQVLAWDAVNQEWCPATITIPNVPPGFAVCNTPPVDGQVLIWDAMTQEWCPADFCTLVNACLNPSFSYGAVHFDGVTSLQNFPAMMDSPKGFISVWLKGNNIFNSRDNGWLLLGPSFFCYIDQYAYGANTYFFQMWDSPSNNSEFQWATAQPMSLSNWVNVLMSWDMDAGGSQVFQLYYNDTAVVPHLAGDLGGTPVEDIYSWPATFGPMPFTIQYSAPSDSNGWSWGNAMDTDMAEAVFAPGQFLDFSNPANRAKFRDPVTGHPISLGADGSLPTGIAPTLYLHITAAETNADNFATNLSGAGSLSIDTLGGLTIASTAP